MKLQLAEVTLLRFTLLILCDIITLSNRGIQLEPMFTEPVLLCVILNLAKWLILGVSNCYWHCLTYFQLLLPPAYLNANPC